MKFEITGNGGNGMHHHFTLGTVVTRIETDDDQTALYLGDDEGYDLTQWVGDDNVQEVV